MTSSSVSTTPAFHPPCPRQQARALVLFAMALWGWAAHAAVSSTFDTDADGWTGLTFTNQGLFINNTLPGFGYHATDGNPGGYVSTLDPGPTLAARLGAPSKFLGNQAVYLGGSLNFDLTIDRAGVVDQDPPPLVLLQNGSASLLYIDSPVPAIGVWTHYVVPLAPVPPTVPLGAGWYAFTAGDPFSVRSAAQGDFDAVFANITQLSITGEFINDGANPDTVGLDNVFLVAVPLPPALSLLLGAMVAVFVAGRRRQAV